MHSKLASNVECREKVLRRVIVSIVGEGDEISTAQDACAMLIASLRSTGHSLKYCAQTLSGVAMW